MFRVLVPPEFGTAIVGTAEQTYVYLYISIIVGILRSGEAQTTNLQIGIYCAVAGVMVNGEELGITRAAILTPSLLTIGEDGEILLGDDALELLLGLDRKSVV